MGLERVPVVTAIGWSEGKKRAYTIADNKIALNSSYDYEMLATELADLQDLEIDLDVLGFSEGELSNLLNAEWEPPATQPMDGEEEDNDGDDDPDKPRGHAIHLDPEAAEVWTGALERMREDDPDLTEPQALVTLVQRCLDDHDPAGA
jgi:hypothetical protein